jgi:peptidoglycan hydrolase-like protein with peptidoglycan-binding domain
MSTHVLAGDPVADRQGTTGDGGWVVEPIPPSADRIVITLGTDPEAEEYDFDIGYVNPIDKVSGVRSRLGNLGYSCGDESGEEIGPRTSAALSAFQRDHGLEVTGELESGTRGAIQDLFQS